MAGELEGLNTEVAQVATDMATAVADMQAEQKEIADLTAKLDALTASGADTVAAVDVQAVTDKLKASSANLEALLAATAAANPPPAPPPAPAAPAAGA